MKKKTVTLFISIFLSVSSVYTQGTDNNREKILANMSALYDSILVQPNMYYYNQLDDLLKMERELYKNTQCVECFGFINKKRAEEITRKAPDNENLYKELLKYKYDTAVSVSNALYEIHSILRSTTKDTMFIHKLTNRMLDFQVAPRHYWLGDIEANDSSFYYNQESEEKLIRIAAKNYNSIEITAYAIQHVKCKNIEQEIYNILAKKYTIELYQMEPNKKEREKKMLEITPELLKEYYPKKYREITDSLIKVYSAEGIQQLYKKDVSRFIYVIGKIYSKTSIPTLEAISRDTIYHSEKERYMAQIALARLGVQEYEDLFLNKVQPKAGELIYICSQASVFRFAELMQDTTKTTGCFPWIWEIIGKDYKDMKVSLAFKYLWMLDGSAIVKGFSAQFDYNYDDYCLFYASNTYSKEMEKTIIKNAINWLEENKGRYILNPYAYDYGLNY